MRELVMRLSDEQLRHGVGKEWTVSSTLAHVAFWDARVMHLLDATKREGKLCAPEIDICCKRHSEYFFKRNPAAPGRTNGLSNCGGFG